MKQVTLGGVAIFALLLASCGSPLVTNLEGTWRVGMDVTGLSRPECADSFLAQSQSFTLEMTKMKDEIQEVNPLGKSGRGFSGEINEVTSLQAWTVGRDLVAVIVHESPDGCTDTVTLAGSISGNRIAGRLEGQDCTPPEEKICFWSGNFSITIER